VVAYIKFYIQCMPGLNSKNDENTLISQVF